MRKINAMLFGIAILFVTCGWMAAQEEAGSAHPPKVLVIYREYVKPGRAGAPHEKTESAFVQALVRAKWPTHYFAADSLSGKPRSLFFNLYNSFADWEKDHQMMMKNPALSATLDRANLADGDLLSETDQTVLMYLPDQSLHADDIDIAHMRGFEVTTFHVKPGHREEWNRVVKMVMDAYSKVPDERWAMYEVAYGAFDRTTFVVFEPFKSGADLDANESKEKQFMDAMGEEGMKKMSEIESSIIDVSQASLFMFNPAMSYPPDAWIQADPDFWKVKSKPAPAAKKPAENPGGGH